MALVPPPITSDSGAGVIARFLKARGVDRVFALCGGHIMPIWMRIDAEGIRIVDVRDERAAVHMAHAHAELTGEARRRAGHRRARRHQRDDRHRQRARRARAGAGALRRAAAARRRIAARCRTWSTPISCARSRATPAPCASRRWCCRNSTRRSRAPSARAASRARSISIFRPTRCAAKCRGRCSSRSTSRQSRRR